MIRTCVKEIHELSRYTFSHRLVGNIVGAVFRDARSELLR